MLNLSKDTVVVAVKDQVSCEVGGESVILHLSSGTYYGLNQVGATVWGLLQEPRAVADIESAIVDQFDVDPAQCERDLQQLLESLANAGLIEVPHEST